MGHDLATVPADARIAQRASVLAAGAARTPAACATVDAALVDEDPLVRVAALGALRSQGRLSVEELVRSLDDPSPSVRIRAAQLAPGVEGTSDHLGLRLIAALDDTDALCRIAALVALGDRQELMAVDAICALATSDSDLLVVEECVAALGALGDPRGLPVVLEATAGKPAMRRRSVAALGAFDDPQVEEALDRLADDRDWQVRQAVAMLRRED